MPEPLRFDHAPCAGVGAMFFPELGSTSAPDVKGAKHHRPRTTPPHPLERRMTAFAEACRTPFSNGTEGDAWMSCWCEHCARDHGIHADNGDPGCSLIAAAMFNDEWPEGWIPEPDDGDFDLPSRMVCTAFQPCEPCGGDPGATERAERVAGVVAYWTGRR